MSISIVACPKCGTLLLNDTAQCHRCRHVLRPEQAAHYREAALPSDAAVQEDLETCKQCGETYRKGLVRCWSCGAFTRRDIEEAYYRLLRGHAFSMAVAGQRHDLPEISPDEVRKGFWADDDSFRELTRSPEVDAQDEDFELSGNISLREDTETKSSAQGMAPAAAGPTPSLATPSAAPSPPTASKSAPAPQAVAAVPSVPSTPPPSPEKDRPQPSPPPEADADTLLTIARQEETDAQKARRARNAVGSFIVYCPMGCQIRVQERHRGKVGRCPKCQATFVVPFARPTSVAGSVSATAGTVPSAATEPAAASTKFSHWLRDVHLHRVVPQKLRIKPDSLLNDFQEVDVGFDPTGLLLVGYSKGKGMFGGKNDKKKEEARAAVAAHLASKPTLEGLPAAFQQDFAREALAQMGMTQPASPGAESLFGDVLVFGAGRIAVRLPKFEEKTSAYLSFSLSQFREFSRLLGEVCGIEAFGGGCGVPLRDEYKTEACHISKGPVRELQQLVYYQKDPAFKLEVAGYRCKVCSAVISEAARAVQKLGGANAKGIAKAKCPKCSKPMGNQPLYVLPVQAPADEPSETPTGAAAPA
jgi:DNA-directed RNA polymerase subunit M/transcription elongation factor TFIIS